VVNPKPSVKINEPVQNGTVNGSAAATARDAAEALLNGNADSAGSGGKKPKQKAYRRSDSTGGNRSRSTTKELALPPDDSLMCPPSFLSGLKPDLEVMDGSRLELKVGVKGDPLPQVTWTKDGKVIASSDILEVKYKNGVASVIIEEVYPEDAGRYACKASNPKGSVETSSRVKIMPKSNGAGGAAKGGSKSSGQPRVYKHLDSMCVRDGDPVKLECQLTNSSGAAFDVVWLHNEKEIKPSKDFQYVTKGNSYFLEIQEIFPEDAGTYTCEAFNDVGECFSTASLVVEVPGDEPDPAAPRFKAFPKSLTVNKGDAAAFVAGLEKAEIDAVTWMKDGKVLAEAPLKVKMNQNKATGLLTLDVKDAGEGDAGQYAVIAANSKGEAKAAFSLNVH